MRRTLELAVQAMIDVLDAMDGDCDLEQDEPDQEHDGAEPVSWELHG